MVWLIPGSPGPLQIAPAQPRTALLPWPQGRQRENLLLLFPRFLRTEGPSQPACSSHITHGTSVALLGPQSASEDRRAKGSFLLAPTILGRKLSFTLAP